jgi:hypothetical protein
LDVDAHFPHGSVGAGRAFEATIALVPGLTPTLKASRCADDANSNLFGLEEIPDIADLARPSHFGRATREPGDRVWEESSVLLVIGAEDVESKLGW